MEPGPSERKLTAILAADVVGYSRLIGADEEGTLSRLQSVRQDVIGPAAANHRGRIVNTSGDGTLIEYVSVLDAVRSAIDLQQALARFNGAAAPDRRMEMRIGINLGDVIVDATGDIFGDGVNIAARLQAIAEPGGIFISEDAYRQVRGKIAAEFADQGPRTLKNIREPVRVYAVAAQTAPPQPAPRALPLPDKPSIAVLPFQNLTGDAAQEYFADAITEDIITALSRWRWFFVIARNSSFVYRDRAVDIRRVGRDLGVRYVLEGSVQRAGHRARITAQLIDAASGSHVWGQAFAGDMRDIFALQDEITEQVVTAVEPAMQLNEGERVARKSLRDLSAFDCFQRGMWHLNRVSREGFVAAVPLFREAIARDPELPLGHIGLARILYGAAVYGWSDEPKKALAESAAAAQAALTLDRRDAYAHLALSGASLYLARHREALAEAEETIALNPNLALAHFRLGQVLIYSGQAAQAIAPIERSMRHSPFDPQLDAMSTALALAHYHAKDYDAALRIASTVTDYQDLGPAAIMAACYGRMNRADEAAAPLAAFLAAFKDVGRGQLLTPYANPEDRADLFEGLRLAGWNGRI